MAYILFWSDLVGFAVYSCSHLENSQRYAFSARVPQVGLQLRPGPAPARALGEDGPQGAGHRNAGVWPPYRISGDFRTFYSVLGTF